MKLYFLGVFIALTFHFSSVVAQEIKRDLNENIFILVEAKVKPGKFDEFIKVASDMSETVKNNEIAALTYEWTISRDSTICYILERYASSEASLNHSNIFREKFAAKFGEVLEFIGLTVFGSPNEELIKAFGPAGEAYRVKVAGFSR